jgi:magnesium and cobalt transporter
MNMILPMKKRSILFLTMTNTANTWMVQALTPIEHFNTILDADFSDDEVETMGGLLLQEIGLVSDLQGQTVELGNWEFTIIEADARTIHLIRAVRQ